MVAVSGRGDAKACCRLAGLGLQVLSASPRMDCQTQGSIQKQRLSKGFPRMLWHHYGGVVTLTAHAVGQAHLTGPAQLEPEEILYR